MASSKYNPIARLQKWMDTMAGQTFMNYAYSWGAAVVILGTLFKLTHIPGANLMLFIGMGTEVFVFFVAGFERVTEKVDEKAEAQQGVVYGGAPVVLGGAVTDAAQQEGQDDTLFSQDSNDTPFSQAQDGTAPVVPIGGVGLDAATAANLAAAGQAAAALTQMQQGAAQTLPLEMAQATDPTAVEEAVKNYTEELTNLTEVLGRVKEQAERMSTDSEEMENLNRTLTGIATVYELQLRNISKQVSTIEQIDEQTKRMAHQIEELNNVYARMIAALTVNMGAAPVAPAAGAED